MYRSLRRLYDGDEERLLILVEYCRFADITLSESVFLDDLAKEPLEQALILLSSHLRSSHLLNFTFPKKGLTSILSQWKTRLYRNRIFAGAGYVKKRDRKGLAQ